MYLEQGKSEAARQSFETALRLDPTCSDAHLGLATFHENQGEISLAEEAYRRALEVRPKNRLILDSLGALLFKNARFDEAKAIFERSIEAAPTSVYGYANLAGVFFMTGELEAAAAILQQGLSIRPHSYLYSNLGNVFFFQGKFRESIEPFRKAVEIDHGSLKHAMWANLGDAYRWTPGYEKEMKEAYLQATKIVRASITRTPDDLHLRSQLAVYLARRGDSEEALAEADRIEQDDGLGPSIYYTLTLTYEQCGERQKALASLVEALEQGYPLEAVEREQELDRLRADSAFARIAERFDEPGT